MSSRTRYSIAEEYFHNINCLAQKIGEDIITTRNAYGNIWNSLTVSEQNQAIDETLISAEIALKYASKRIDEPLQQLPKSYPKLCIQTGMKYIIDETGLTLRWRDEHSAPFSFMTQSQMNLCISSDAAEEEAKEDFNESVKEIKFEKSNNHSEIIHPINEARSIIHTHIDDGVFSVLQSNSISDNPKNGQNDELNIPATIKSHFIHQSPPHLNTDDSIPKTGFEFLDNW